MAPGDSKCLFYTKVMMFLIDSAVMWWIKLDVDNSMFSDDWRRFEGGKGAMLVTFFFMSSEESPLPKRILFVVTYMCV